MCPKIVDKETRKREIALSAIDLLAEKGFETTTISAIAEAAGIGKGTIYEYFQSKEDLIAAALVYWIESMSEEPPGDGGGPEDPAERLRNFVGFTLDKFLSDERGLRIMFQVFRILMAEGGGSSVLQITPEIFAKYRQSLVDIILDGVSLGRFRREAARDAQKIAINLMAYMDGIWLHSLVFPGYFDLRKQIEFYLDDLLRSLSPVGFKEVPEQ